MLFGTCLLPFFFIVECGWLKCLSLNRYLPSANCTFLLPQQCFLSGYFWIKLFWPHTLILQVKVWFLEVQQIYPKWGSFIITGAYFLYSLSLNPHSCSFISLMPFYIWHLNQTFKADGSGCKCSLLGFVKFVVIVSSSLQDSLMLPVLCFLNFHPHLEKIF